MRQVLIIGLLGALCLGLGKADKAYLKQLKLHRKALQKKYRKPETSPLKDAAKSFQGLDFFAPNLAYRVEANFRRTQDAQPFEIPTSNPDRNKHFVTHGILSFEIAGKSYELRVYRNLSLPFVKPGEESLFLPFKDYTNGNESYGGGRYLDIPMPTGNTLMLDFNYCYSPYCAHGTGWSCPIPPEENHLEVAIPAGMMHTETH